MLKIIIVLVVTGTSLTAPAEDFSFLCEYKETTYENIKVSKLQPYQVREYELCMSVPPRCEVYHTRTKIVIEEIRVPKTVVVQRCCDGYTKDKDAGICVPQCSAGCAIGSCVAPNICQCMEGFGGPQCDITCPYGLWGSECENECICQNNAICGLDDGACTCLAGFIGKACEDKCPDGYYGEGCLEKCVCVNGTCDHVSGDCRCHPGWIGASCQEVCPFGKYGYNCELDCMCQNDAKCDPETGKCSCEPGWLGATCEVQCPSGFWGSSCTNSCNCSNSQCDHVTGECICEYGWAGDMCDIKCPEGKYGTNCEKTCHCIMGFCDAKNDRCICWDGWEGNNCSKPCDDGFYGFQCKEICLGDGLIHIKCHHVTGEPKCLPGYTGILCKTPCPTGTFGQDCQMNCTCENGSSCNHKTGQCHCSPGWIGANCETPCPEGTYGTNCAKNCQCSEYSNCNPENGICSCGIGKSGTNCTEICPMGHCGSSFYDQSVARFSTPILIILSLVLVLGIGIVIWIYFKKFKTSDVSNTASTKHFVREDPIDFIVDAGDKSQVSKATKDDEESCEVKYLLNKQHGASNFNTYVVGNPEPIYAEIDDSYSERSTYDHLNHNPVPSTSNPYYEFGPKTNVR